MLGVTEGKESHLSISYTIRESPPPIGPLEGLLGRPQRSWGGILDDCVVEALLDAYKKKAEVLLTKFNHP